MTTETYNKYMRLIDDLLISNEMKMSLRYALQKVFYKWE